MFANVKIARKLLAAFAIMIAAFLLTAGFIVDRLDRADRATAVVRKTTMATIAARAIFSSFVAEQNGVRGFVISQSENLLGNVERERAGFEGHLKAFRAVEADPALQSRMAGVESLVREWRVKSADKQIALARDPQTRVEATKFVSGQFASKIQAGLDEIIAAEDALNARYSADQDRASSTVLRGLLVSAAVMLVAAGLLCWMLHRSIAQPVRAMTAAMKRLAGGDVAVEVPARGRKDEVGEMAGALQVFKDAAVDKLRVEGEAAETSRRADADRQATEAERAEAAALQSLVVTRLGAGLSRLSAGDLTTRIEEAFAPEYEKLRADFNAALSEIHSAMRVIVTNTAALRSGTGEITQAADDLARRTEQQAASLEQTAAALGEITSTVRRTAEGAQQARDTVDTARSDAEHSGKVVQDAVAAMSEIERSAQQISQIIGVIDEIAFQTNLLALNAGVEAARAGEAGRGFAVVASEVRALAQRSAEAAKEIKALISTSTQQVSRGVNLVDETGKSLARIVAQVGQINGVVAEIAASAREQATGLAEVNGAINQMDQVTQQNAAMVEESTAASHALAREAEELARLTARFQIGGAEARDRSETRDRAETIRPDPAARPALRMPRVHGATALAARPSAEQDGWEEF